MMSPILKEVKDNVGDAVSVIKVDVDKNPQAAAMYQVHGVPTLILFKNGEPVWRQSGVLPKANLIKIIEQFTSKN
jgi:thioredoxin 1